MSARVVIGTCSCGATLGPETTLWLGVRVYPAFAGASPSAWSVCSWRCVERLAQDMLKVEATILG